MGTRSTTEKTPKKPKVGIEQLITVDPLNENQDKVFRAWKKDNQNVILSGSAGTGKTFTALYLALELVLDKAVPLEKIHIFRSVVPSRDVGFLPGSLEEKLEPYLEPYRNICAELFTTSVGAPIKNSFDLLIENGIIEVHSTSFVRGNTFNNSVMIVDEMQNMNGRELNSVITRAGEDTRLMFCGDYAQSDFSKNSEKKDILAFLHILNNLSQFETVEFTWRDIVRSDFVREYIMTKEMMQKDNEIEINW